MLKRYKDPKQELIEKEACPRCKREHVMKESPRSGDYFCSKCGYVSPFPYIDETSEFRNFAVEHGVKDKSRACNAGDDIVEVLGTGIAYDGSSKAKEMSRYMQRVASQQDPQVAKLKKHVHKIKNLGGLLQLSKAVIEAACKIFKEALDMHLADNQKSEPFDAACIYYACLSQKVPKTMKEIALASENLTKKEINKAADIVKNVPSLEKVYSNWADSVQQFCRQLNLPSDIQEACYEVAQYLNEINFLEGKNPLTKVAVVISHVCNSSPDEKDHRSLESIQMEVGPKKETIAERLKEIRNIPLQNLSGFQKILKKTPTFN